MQTNPSRGRSRDLVLFIFSIVGVVGLAGRGIYLLVTGILNYDPQSIPALASNCLEALSMWVCAALVLPMLITSFRQWKGREIPQSRIPPVKFWQVAAAFGIWIFVVVIGGLITISFSYGWLVAAPFFLVGILLPVAGLLWVIMGGLPTGSWRRLWSALGIGMTGSTVLAVVGEYLLLALGVAIVGIASIGHPEWLAALKQLQSQVKQAQDTQALATLLAPYLVNPFVLLAVLVFASGFVPLIEESVKPLAVWLLGKKLHSPAEGFALGALGGAGFALVEGFMSASGNPTVLGVGVAARATSSLMHITASAVLGWGIASAFLEKRYGRLALAYLTSMTIHGLWNGAALLTVYGALRFSTQPLNPDIVGMVLALGGVCVLGLQLVVLLIALPLINRRLRSRLPVTVSHLPEAAPATQNDIIAPPNPGETGPTV